MSRIGVMLSRRAGLALVASVLGLVGFTEVANAATYRVTQTTDSNDGSCTPALCSLRDAVVAADNAGGASAISVPAGTYTLSIPSAGPNDPTTGDLNVQSGSSGNPAQITLTGAGSGSTVIDAAQVDRAFSVEASTGSTDNALTLSGVTIKNGKPATGCDRTGSDQGACHYGEGGAIYSAGRLALNGDVTLTENSAPFQSYPCAPSTCSFLGIGGAIYSDSPNGSALSISHATLSQNSSNGQGGAVYDNAVVPVTITGSTLDSNSSASACGGAVAADNGPLTLSLDTLSDNTAGSCGGALYYDDNRPLTVIGSAFTHNTASDFGGAIDDDDSSVATMSNNRFVGNTATNQDGGALYADNGSTYNLRANEFDNNSAPGGSGGGLASYAQLNSTGDSFVGNSSQNLGGGAVDTTYCHGSVTTYTNATFSHNTAAQGGGLALVAQFCSTYPVDLVNDTVFNNSASSSGGGIWSSDASQVTPNLVGVQNTIVARNAGGDCASGNGPSQFAAREDAGYNLDGDGSCFSGTGASGDKTNTDPLLAQPADNGGPVLTDAELSGSPAIDSGTDANCPASDARGVARPQGASCDRGAYEVINGTGQLSLSKTAPPSATAGSPFTYTINVGNKGPGQSSSTTVVDQLPANTAIIGVSASQGACVAAGTPAKLTCALGTLASGAGATVSLIVTVSRPGAVTNSASVSNDQGSSASGSATTVITSAAAGSAPTAITGGHRSVKSSSAVLLGTVQPGAQSTGYFFEVGKTRHYGLLTAVGQTGTATASVSELIRSLSRATRYHYRLVAINGSGTSYGADRTFRTSGSRYLGRLVLDGRRLPVRQGRVFAKFTCRSSKACVFRYSITIHARVAKTHKVATLSFTRSRTTLKRIAAHQTVTVSSSVSPAALTVLSKSARHEMAGKLTTRPRTRQKGLITQVTLVES